MDNRDSKSSWIREQWRLYEESQTTMGVIFAGVAALFIAGIAAAFIYSKDTNPTQTASAPAASINAPAPPIARVPETTGSGGGSQYNPPKQDPRENEQMERPR
jgi:hypothetical protein